MGLIRLISVENGVKLNKQTKKHIHIKLRWAAISAFPLFNISFTDTRKRCIPLWFTLCLMYAVQESVNFLKTNTSNMADYFLGSTFINYSIHQCTMFQRIMLKYCLTEISFLWKCLKWQEIYHLIKQSIENSQYSLYKYLQ